MISNKIVKISLLFIFSSIFAASENHFVINGSPSSTELDALIADHKLSYRSHGCFGSNIHYFTTKTSGEKLLDLYEKIRLVPWVETVEHQYPLYLQKKDVISDENIDDPEVPFHLLELPNDDEYRLVYEHHAKLLREKLNFNDPNAQYMWQLLNDGNPNIGKNPGIDLNAYPVYAVNITGKNVIAIVVDDALDTTHEDLIPNINFDLLTDLINDTRTDARGTDAKMPKSNDHGTEVAGLYAAVANNSRCTFGVAYDAKLGAVRLLEEKVTDYMVGEALSMFSENASIYISSWGPPDNGRSFRSPGKYMREALAKTWLHGNHGKGSVFVFPSGNGGLHGDNCGADGFVNHPNVISVSALSENGLPPSYAEACGAVSVAVPVGGAEDKITFRQQLIKRHLFVPTTHINNKCTVNFVGTSASNPMAAGVIALAFEANPNLKPRDVSAIIALSGRIPTASAEDIYINGGGYMVSHTYGSGLLDAVRMVKLAKSWVPLGPRISCVKHSGKWARSPGDMDESPFSQEFYPHKTVNFTFSFDSDECNAEIIELVRVGMQWTSVYRGSLEVKLTSPSGQFAYLLYPRLKDHFHGKSEMLWKSMMHTGENAYGNWTVSLRDVGKRKDSMARASSIRASGTVRFIGIELLGTRRSKSAFEQNKENIVKHWHPVRKIAYDKNEAVILDRQKIAEIYDYERWHMLSEKMED